MSLGITLPCLALLLLSVFTPLARAQFERSPGSPLDEDPWGDGPMMSAARQPSEGAMMTSLGDGGGQILAPKAKKDLEEGDKALRAGRYEEATEQFEKAYRLAPGNPRVNLFMGITLLGMHRMAEAADFLNRSNSLEPNAAATLTALGMLNLEQGNFAGAVSSVDPVLKAKPKEYLPHLIAAEAYLQQHRFQNAAEEAQQALRWSKGLAIEAEFTAGSALAAMGRSVEALLYLRKFVTDAPSSPVVKQANVLIRQLTPSQTPTAR